MAWSERTQETSRKRLICDADFIVPGHGKVIFIRLFIKCLKIPGLPSNRQNERQLQMLNDVILAQLIFPQKNSFFASVIFDANYRLFVWLTVYSGAKF